MHDFLIALTFLALVLGPAVAGLHPEGAVDPTALSLDPPTSEELGCTPPSAAHA